MHQVSLCILWMVTAYCMPMALKAGMNRDSLSSLLEKTADRQKRVDILIHLSQSYMLESTGQVRAYALKALSLSDSLDYQPGIVKALSNLTWAARSSGDYALALEYASKCLQAAEVIDDLAGTASAKYEMAAVYQAQGDYGRARAMFKAARPNFEQVRDTYGIGKCYNGVAESYRWEEKWDSALAFYADAEKYFAAIEHRKGMILLLGNRGLVYSGRKQYEKALDTLYAANRAAAADNFVSVMLETSIEITRIWMEKQRFNEAEAEATKALASADSAGLKKYVHDAAEVLYDIAILREDFESALEFQRIVFETAATLQNEEVTNRLSNLDFELTMRSKEAEIDGLQKDKRIRSLWQSLLGVLLAVALVIFLLMAFAYRRNRQTTKLLAIQNEQLGELNREKDSLMNIVAHDLKSPLSKVKALSMMIGIAGPLAEKQKTALGMIDKVVTDGERLIQDLLDISHAEAAGNVLKVEQGELNALVQEWMGQHRENATRKRIDLVCEPGPGEIMIRTELSYVARVFDNLVSNAIKYTPSDRKVLVKTWKDAGKMYISVKDEGPGITKADQEKMFRKFQRLTARPTGGESSSGLGLSIIKTLTERLDGTVSLESELGQGSTFTVVLPLEFQQS